MFGYYFLKLFLRIILKNIENIILMFFKNCFGYPNLVFFMFFKTKPNMLSLFSLLFLFLRRENSFQKQKSNIPLIKSPFILFRTHKELGSIIYTPLE